MRMIGKHFIISCLLAYFVTYNLTYGYVVGNQPLIPSGSVFAVGLFGALVCLFYHSFFPLNRHKLVSSGLPGIILGGCVAFGAEFASVGMVTLARADKYYIWASASVLFTAVLCALFTAIPSVKTILWEAEAKIRRRLPDSFGFRSWLLIFLAVSLLWLPAFLAVYPGIYTYDASVQILQIFGDNPLSSHHSPIHTLFLCGSLGLGHALFGNYQAGMAIHSLVQAGMMNAVFSYVIWRMLNRRLPFILTAGAFLFFAINPIVQIFMFLTTKDVIFGGLFLLAFSYIADACADERAFFESIPLQIRFYGTVLLACLFRNQGIYVFLFFVIFFLFAMRWRKKRIFLGAMLTVLLYAGITGPLYTSLGVRPGDGREALSVPMQQMARVMNVKPEAMSPEEQQYVLELIPEEYLNKYTPTISDPVKEGFRTEVVTRDPLKFVGMWLSIGFKAPTEYLLSFFWGSCGYWYPDITQYWGEFIMFDGTFMDPEHNILGIARDGKFPFYERYLRGVALDRSFERAPIVSTVMGQAFPFWMMVISWGVLNNFRRRRNMLPLALVLGYWGTLLLGPVVSVRYAFPIMLCVPGMAVLCVEAARVWEA